MVIDWNARAFRNCRFFIANPYTCWIRRNMWNTVGGILQVRRRKGEESNLVSTAYERNILGFFLSVYNYGKGRENGFDATLDLSFPGIEARLHRNYGMEIRRLLKEAATSFPPRPHPISCERKQACPADY